MLTETPKAANSKNTRLKRFRGLLKLRISVSKDLGSLSGSIEVGIAFLEDLGLLLSSYKGYGRARYAI